MQNQPLTHNNPQWHAANENYLMDALAIIRHGLTSEDTKENINLPHFPDTALDQLCNTFALSDFERNVLLLCVGMELDANWGNCCANSAKGDSSKPYPTFLLAMSLFPNSYWNALSPSAPLRKWQLINIGQGTALTLSPLRIDERVLHYLIGSNQLDERLWGLVEPLVILAETHVPSHLQLAQQLATIWEQSQQAEVYPAVQLCGDEVSSKRAIAFTACKLLNLNLHLMSAATVANFRTNEMNEMLRLWEREAIFSNSALLLDCEEVDNVEREGVISRLIENIRSPLIITSLERRRSLQRPLINIDVHKPSASEQRAIWQQALGETATNLNGHIETLVSHFNLSALTINTICTEAKGKSQIITPETPPLTTLLWDTCRSQARPRMDELAQPIQPSAGWDDLVIPEAQRQVLRDIAAHVRQRTKVYEQWGFGNRGARGLGISALFAGASGTGKTMAAEVIADELRLDLYRIDLSQVVSKYIGETEKNLRRVFDAAETGGAILLFDEADALFGKRSDVKDSHDRHANIEVGYLLQRMEAYRGLAVLTTNLKGSLDQAFLRRIRFIVQFPFPDAHQRGEIWQRIFPKQTPTHELEPELLAKLNVSGGNIRNIALNAAFLAADAGEPVQMKHILQAAKSEYAKLERPLTDTEVKGWV
jgi:hypothetical protein